MQQAKKEFFAHMEIPYDRGIVLEKSVIELYKGQSCTIKQIMLTAREDAQNANEDMFICYLVGFVHAQTMIDSIQIIHIQK